MAPAGPYGAYNPVFSSQSLPPPPSPSGGGAFGGPLSGYAPSAGGYGAPAAGAYMQGMPPMPGGGGYGGVGAPMPVPLGTSGAQNTQHLLDTLRRSARLG